MATGTPGSVARQYPQQVVHYLRCGLTHSMGNAVQTVGTIPAGALILRPLTGLHVSTAFNGTTPVLDLGFQGGAADGLAADLAMAAAAFVVSNGAGAHLVATDTVITATMALTGATAGSGEVIVAFIPDNDK